MTVLHYFSTDGSEDGGNDRWGMIFRNGRVQIKHNSILAIIEWFQAIE